MTTSTTYEVGYCEHCGKVIQTSSVSVAKRTGVSRKKYCSDDCRWAAFYLRQLKKSMEKLGQG